MTAVYSMYYDAIKKGNRVYSEQSASVQTKVKALADAELAKGVIKQDEYNKYLGIQEGYTFEPEEDDEEEEDE